MKINVLGTEYEVIKRAFEDEDVDGYCDLTSKEIHIRNDNENEVGDFERLMRKQMRHEIIHAFMGESGLQANWQHPEEFGHDETTVDWFAIQIPKMLKVFEAAGCMD